MTETRKEYMKGYMRKKRMEERGEPPYKWLKVPISLFEGKGRGAVVDGFVLIARSSDTEDTVVSEEDWKARLDWTCKHGRPGWSCKECLK